MITTDWERVTHCPLCGRQHNDMNKTVGYHSGVAGVINANGIEIPWGLAVSYSHCIWCDMEYQNPRLTDDARRRFYTNGFYLSLTQERSGDYQLERVRAKRLVDIIQQIGAGSVLDIGCGHGELLQACQDGDIEAVGVDLNNIAMDGLIVLPSLEDVGERTFDVVAMIHYLEHTVDPLAELRTAMEYSNRYILIEVPLQDRDKFYLNLPHTLVFEPHTLVSATERVGLKIHGMAIYENFVILIGYKDGT